jgi:endonuclease/exonuclease/phosphatase (EEP) superfamily protein YafD
VGDDRYLIMAGDFNLEDRSALDHFVTGHRLRSQFEGAPTRPSGGTSDELYLGEALTSIATETVDIGSDHFALVCRLGLT